MPILSFHFLFFRNVLMDISNNWWWLDKMRKIFFTHFAGNRYKYPFPSSDQRMTRSFARKSPPNQRSPDGDITLQSTVKSPRNHESTLVNVPLPTIKQFSYPHHKSANILHKQSKLSADSEHNNSNWSHSSIESALTRSRKLVPNIYFHFQAMSTL